ncbi:MAG: DUF2577 domain-containing protein [Lachnospiraceae bacterium]|jgi:Protein of unknown function (DUF2577).
MTEETSFKQLLQGIAGDDLEVLQGIVKSASPLKIQIVNDDKLTIGLNITYVPRHLTDYKTEISGPNIQSYYYTGNNMESGTAPVSSSHVHALGRIPVTVHNALKVGEKVHVLSFNHGKQYYVLDRTEG